SVHTDRSCWISQQARAQNGVHPPLRKLDGTFGSGLLSLKFVFKYSNTTFRSTPETLSTCDSLSESHRAFVRCPIAEQAVLWQVPQLFRTRSRPAPAGKMSATVAGAGADVV